MMFAIKHFDICKKMLIDTDIVVSSECKLDTHSHTPTSVRRHLVPVSAGQSCGSGVLANKIGAAIPLLPEIGDSLLKHITNCWMI